MIQNIGSKPSMQEIAYFQLIDKVGGGGFGDVWVVRSTEDEELYAMKLEPVSSKRQTLEFESNILKKICKSHRFPSYVINGTEDEHHYLVMEYLGPNLHVLSAALPASFFSIPYVYKLADDMLWCIEEFHSKGYVHRDIKPQNFVVRLDGDTCICLIDYGIAKLYIDNQGKHLQPRDHMPIMGSPIYASPNTHHRMELSRRDDLYSWIYSILSISEPGLPWIGKSIEEAGKIKDDIPLSVLSIPLGPPFVEICQHIEKLQFEDTPDYAMIHRKLSEAAKNPEALTDYEWMVIQPMNEEDRKKDHPFKFDPTGFISEIMPKYDKKKCLLV